MKLITGDIITATIKGNPFFYHIGIVIANDEKIQVVHNTPMRKNSTGGNVITETLEEFLAAGRKILSRKATGISHERILAAAEAVKNLPFDALNFNCEDFIFFVRTGKRRKQGMHLMNKLFPLSRAFSPKNRRIIYLNGRFLY